MTWLEVSTRDQSVPPSRQKEYERLNGKYLREGEELLAEGDYAQASEKFWGATAEIIKAAAAARGLSLGAHRSLGEFIERLDQKDPDWRLLRAFNAANSLHLNCYEDWLPPAVVRDGAAAVRELVAQLRSLL